MIAEEAWEASIDDFDFSPAAQRNSEVKVHLYGLRRGRPEPIVKVIESMVRDGDLESVIAHKNRDLVLLAAFEGHDPDALAEKEEELALAIARARTFRWTPSALGSATTVYDLHYGSLAFNDDSDWDIDELDGLRTWTIELRARPFGRSDVEMTATAGAATGGTDTQVNACDSLTGWTAVAPLPSGGAGTLSIDTDRYFEGGKSIRINPPSSSEAPLGGGYYTFTLEGAAELTGLSLSLAATPFLSVKVDGTYASARTVRMWADGVELADAGSTYVGGPTGAFYIHSFRCTDTSVSKLRVQISVSYTVYDPSFPTGTLSGPPLMGIRFDDVRRGPVPANASATGRETTSIFPIAGSARTEASIEIAHATSGLGDVFVYTSPYLGVTGYTPDLRRWATTVAGDGGGGTISGRTGALATGAGTTVFQIPAAPLPSGSYLLHVVGNGGAPTGTVTVIARVRSAAGTVLGDRSYTMTPAVLPGTTSFAVLGALTLPTVDLPEGTDCVVELDIAKVGSGGWSWDEFLLCHVSDDAAITAVAAGTGAKALGAANNRLWIDAPTPERSAGGIFLGTDPARADAYHAGVVAGAWGEHQLVPRYTPIFVANTGAANPSITAHYWPRWLFHARDLSGWTGV
ncbi:hypothetical protein GCM10022215_24110 [Nocardioides fonticola]|uniref:Minor tail protein n=2 Tax=Nocardioides fonticola TaxID=450363 RepID=A0ABP7XKS4_9ACTN